MYCSPPGSSVHGISQAGILEWVAISSSRGSARHRDWTHVSCIAGRFFTTRKAHESLLLISNGAMKILFLLFCFMFVGCFSIFHLNIWWAFLWLYLVTSDFAPLWGPLPLLGIHFLLPSTLASTKPDWLQFIFSGSTCVYDLPWLHCSSCTPLLWAPLGAVLTVSVHCLPSFLVANSLLQHVHEPLEGTGCVLLWGAWPRTCDYECLLNECSNPVWLMQNVWKCDIKPPFTWKIEVVTQWVILVLGNPECALCSVSMRWGMVYLYLCVHSLERGHSHMALNPCLVCWCFL